MLSRLAFLALILPTACGEPRKAGPPGGGGPPAMPVKLLTLTSTTIRDATEYIGTLKSRRSITVQPQVEGQITKIFVKSGDTVQPGTPLMQIDPAGQVASVRTAQANRASREAALAYAKQQLARTQRLFDTGAGSKQDLDQARSQLDAARADVQALGAQIQQSQVQLQYYRIVAPGRGVVGDIPVRVGDRVTPQTVLTTIDDNSALEAYISIPVERAGQVKMGTEVEILDAAGNPLGAGHITFISPQVNPETQSIPIKSDLQGGAASQPTSQPALRAEQFIRARVVWSTHEGLTVPALAVVRLNGQTFVYTAESVGQGMTAKLRPVQLGDLSASAYVVLSGVKPGEKIVVGQVQKLQDGAPIMEPPQQAQAQPGAH